MAQPVRDQAAAMLCFCLKNLSKDDFTGSILHDLSEKALPERFPERFSMFGPGQLVTAASLLASRLLVLGFGIILAEHALRIHDAYENLGKLVPCDLFDLFDPMTRERTVDFLHSLSSVFSDEECLLRVLGTQAMGHTMAIILIVFPEDATIVVEDVIIHEGRRKSIVVELDSSKRSLSPTLIQMEK